MTSKNLKTRAIMIGLTATIVLIAGLYYKLHKEQPAIQDIKTPGQVDAAAQNSEAEKQTRIQQKTLGLSDRMDSKKSELKQCDAIIGRETMAMPGYESRQSDNKLSANEREAARQKILHANELIASTKKKKEQLEKEIAAMEKTKQE